LIKIIKTIKKYFEWFGNYVLNIFPGLLIILTIIAVFNRYFLDYPMSWNEEISLWISMAIVFWGIIHASKNNKHFRIDILMKSLKEREQKYLEVMILVILLLISLLGIYFGIKIVTMTSSKTVVFRIPQKIIILSTMVMGFIGISLEYLYQLITKIKELKQYPNNNNRINIDK